MPDSPTTNLTIPKKKSTQLETPQYIPTKTHVNRNTYILRLAIFKFAELQPEAPPQGQAGAEQ